MPIVIDGELVYNFPNLTEPMMDMLALMRKGGDNEYPKRL